VKTLDKLDQTRETLAALETMAGWNLKRLRSTGKGKRNLARALQAAKADVETLSRRLVEENATEELAYIPVLSLDSLEERTL
jgi:hypothetical protein